MRADVMRRTMMVAGALAVAAFPACSDSGGPTTTIVSMQLMLSDETVTIQADSTITDSLALAGTEDLVATFYDADGVLVNVPGTDFTLAMVPDTVHMQYVPTGPFTGVMTARAAGQTTFDVSVRDVLSGGTAFGPFEVDITVQ